MAPGWKKQGAKSFFLGLFSSRKRKVMSEDRSAGAGGSYPTPTATMFGHSRDITIQGGTFVEYSGESAVSKAMERLSNYIIAGAAHDSSARHPLPRCHPGTRIKINERILSWFHDSEKRELLLWIYGHAGVGKSAIVQTIAEHLSSSNHLGASVFISRANGRNDFRYLFITIAYQLATRIELYRNFVAGKLALDPDLVTKGLKEQFQTFIVEPFAEKKMWVMGGELWGILLDGLDELDEQQAQREVIRLIASFVLQHPHVPLLWIISGRPEPLISRTFKNDRLSSSYQEMDIPVDSPDAYEDVERYLSDSFETIRNDFPDMVPVEWPSHEKVQELAHAASGLFAFASMAIRSIEDPNYGDPVARLDEVLSALRDSESPSSDDQPFAYLDALYTRILNSIPSRLWPTTKRMFGAILYQGHPVGIPLSFKALSVILGLEPEVIRASLNSCISILKIPLPENVYQEPIAFYHTSLGGYLMAPSRSGGFHISMEAAEDDILRSSFRIWQDFKRQFSSGPDLEYLTRWRAYCSQYHSNGNQPHWKRSGMINEFDFELLHSTHGALYSLIVAKHDHAQPFVSDEDRDQCFEILSVLDSTTIRLTFKPNQIVKFYLWLSEIWKNFREELTNKGIVCETQFKQLEFEHLDWPTVYPIHTWSHGAVEQLSETKIEPYSSKEFHEYLTGLKSFQARNPEIPVLISGSPGKRFAIFEYQYSEDDFKIPVHHASSQPLTLAPVFGYYLIPCPGER